jgi:hypothetical protein
MNSKFSLIPTSQIDQSIEVWVEQTLQLMPDEICDTEKRLKMKIILLIDRRIYRHVWFRIFIRTEKCHHSATKFSHRSKIPCCRQLIAIWFAIFIFIDSTLAVQEAFSVLPTCTLWLIVGQYDPVNGNRTVQTRKGAQTLHFKLFLMTQTALTPEKSARLSSSPK